MSEDTNKTSEKPWLFKKGNPGGPGRPVGKSLKEYSREYLAKMTDEERQEFLEGIPKVDIWKMSEGNPKQDTDVTTNGESLTPLLVKFLNNDNPSNGNTE